LQKISYKIIRQNGTCNHTEYYRENNEEFEDGRRFCAVREAGSSVLNRQNKPHFFASSG